MWQHNITTSTIVQAEYLIIDMMMYAFQAGHLEPELSAAWF